MSNYEEAREDRFAAYLDIAVQMAAGEPIEFGKCTRCSARTYEAVEGGVYHAVRRLGVTFIGEDPFMLERGCRAASYDSDTGWNEAIPAGWKASNNPNVSARLVLA